MATLQTFYRLRVHDAQGRLRYDSGRRISHSYVLQFLRLLEGFYTSTTTTWGDETATDTANSTEYITRESNQPLGRADAGVNNDNYGVVVGTNAGSTAEANTNYVLDTQIAEGTGAGQLTHQSTLFVAPTEVAGAVEFDISRAFVNGSGGTITVKEIGVYCFSTVVSVTHYFLLLRDVVSDTAVDDGETVTVVYTLSTTA